MGEPSKYELEAWIKVQAYKGRPISKSMRAAGEQFMRTFAELGKQSTSYLESHPVAKAVVERSQSVAGDTGKVIADGARKAVSAIPDGVTDWGGASLESVQRTVGRLARAGLSAKQVIAKHNKRGHNVEALDDLRQLDLRQIDEVRGRGITWYYPAAAALSGAGAGLAISGGEIFITTTAGAAAAPSGAIIVGAFAGDAAAVYGLSSRAVGHVALFYGYDPEDPAEKLFVMSVVNAGTALTVTAKTAAMADISRLTQALFRSKAWVVLNETLVAKVSTQFMKAFSIRLTKQGLGKAVPAIGILIGGTFNWATLEAIVDAADVAYRRRFLLEKYPYLDNDDRLGPNSTDVVHSAEDIADQDAFSIVEEITKAGGPDFRNPSSNPVHFTEI